jgi:hypothetical protein
MYATKRAENVLRQRKLVRELGTLQKLVKRRVITGLESVLHSNENRAFGVTGFKYESKYPEGISRGWHYW